MTNKRIYVNGNVVTINPESPKATAFGIFGDRFFLVGENEEIHNAVNRKTRDGELLGSEERIPVLEALKAYTINAAYCSFEESIKGSIEVGKLADFTVLSENPLTAQPEGIKDIRVEATTVGGRLVFGSY